MLTTQKDTSWTFHALNLSGKPNNNKSVPINTLSSMKKNMHTQSKIFPIRNPLLGESTGQMFLFVAGSFAGGPEAPLPLSRQAGGAAAVAQHPGHFTR